MIPVAFNYVRARDVPDALRLLEEHGDDGKILAGGHSLIPMMKLRLAAPGTIIDIGAIPGLAGIAHDGKRIEIGALTKHAAVAASRELAEHAPVLSHAANELGDPQVRNRGTIGGACAHGDPSADYPAVMLALDATFTLTGRFRLARHRRGRVLHRHVRNGARSARIAHLDCVRVGTELGVCEIPPSGVGLRGRRGGGQAHPRRRPHRRRAGRVHRGRRRGVPRARRRGGPGRA